MRAYRDLEEIRDGVLASSRSKHKDRLKGLSVAEFFWGWVLLDKKTKRREAIVINASKTENVLLVLKRDGSKKKVTMDRLFKAYLWDNAKQCGIEEIKK